MAVAFGSAGTRFVQNPAGTSWAVAYPSGISAGDILLLHISTNGGAVTSSSLTGAGWTEVFKPATVTNPRGGLWLKVASGSESGTITVTTASTTGNAIMFRYTGVDTTTPQDATATTIEDTSGTDTTTDIPSITTVTDGAMLIYANAGNSSTVTMTAADTERVDHGALGGTGAKCGAVYDVIKTTAGASGTKTITLSSARAYWGVMIALRPGSVGLLSTLVQRVAGISATPTTAVRVAIKTTACTSARLKLGTDSGLTTGVVFGSAGTPDADGYVTLTATGLTANTRYYYRVEMTDSNSTVGLDTMSTVGRIKTAPSGQASFAFDFGSCANSTDPIVFPLITARADDMFFHLGDMYYNDGSGTTLANIRSKLEGKIQATNHAALYAQINMAHTPGDHDVAQNDSNNGTDPTAWGNYRTASAQLFPDVDFYYTWVWGRVRFIKIDLMNYADDRTLTDNSSKSLMGTTQKQWFKDTIDAATEPAMVIIQSDPWVGAAVANDSGWFGFTTERTELANYMVNSGKNFIIIGGDMHAVAADDGTNSPGGITVFQAAPFGQTASQKGGPWSHGPVPSSGTAFVTHYGRVVVTDNGGSISFAYNGYDSTDTSLVSLTKTFTLTVEAALSGSGTLSSTQTMTASASGSLSGSGTLTSTQTPAVTVGTVNLSGSGTLSSAVTVAFSRSGALSGSGTLVGSGQTPAITVSTGLSGDGTLTYEQDAATASSSAALSSTGTLTKTVVANFVASMSQTSTGTMAPTIVGMSAQALAAFSGSGTLTSARTPAITVGGGLSGSGSLTSVVVPAVSITSNLTSEGTLTGGSSNSFEANGVLSGSGTLTSSNIPALSQSAALSGSGTLSANVIVNRSVSVNLSGSGTLSPTLTGVGFVKTSALSGSGTLSGTGLIGYTAQPQFSGSGTLGSSVTPATEYIFVGSGSGSLTGDTTPGLTVTGQLSGVGTLVGTPEDQLNFDVVAYLAEKRWNIHLGPQRWKGTL